ncbi:hypothetical protein [Polymorphospora rubra]|uniref:Uncharacterized protein n=1 Tax=Polymorphospora rubra TaxID=338584 RepID=A0A810N563_9ACTN|nr:hypothetical protein [Polymorphospora rubra]BCJ68536.1 hypothetical protein Prubr_55570 [Polymorphospora rubra]
MTTRKYGFGRARPGGRWRRALAALLVAATAATGNLVTAAAGHAASGVVIQEDVLRAQLFGSYMRSRTNGHEGLKNLWLSAELLGHRQLHPQATQQQLLQHVVQMNDVYNSRIKAADLERPLYQFMVKLLDFSAQHPAGSIPAPIMKELIESTVGRQLENYGGMVDEIHASQFRNAFFTQVYQVQERVWGEIARRGASDATFTAAWNSYLGVRFNVSADATTDQLLADPLLAAYVNTQALLDHSANLELYLREGNAALSELLAQLNTRLSESNTQASNLNVSFPVVGPNPTQTDLDRARAQVQQRQQWIDGAAGALRVLSTLVGFADEKAGKAVATTGTAAVQIATAVNQWIPSIAGKTLNQALTSMSTLVLAGNLIGALQTLAPLFLRTAPTLDEQILAQVLELKERIVQLESNMNTRFDRIENALVEIYKGMTLQFDELLKGQRLTHEQLAQIIRNLSDLTAKVDFWGENIFLSLKADKFQGVERIINQWVGYRTATGGREMTWPEYWQAATDLEFAAETTSTQAPLAAPVSDHDVSTVLNTYGPGGALAYLNAYARRNLELPAGSVATKVPDVEYWLLAAEGYKMLVAQNPDHARGVTGQAEAVMGAGQHIQATVRMFSQPQESGPVRLNKMFVKLLDNYDRHTQAMTAEFTRFAQTYPSRPGYSVFLPANQTVPEKPTAEPSAVAHCSRSGVATRSRPANVVSLDLQELWVTQYARPNTPVQVCYETSWTNTVGPEEPDPDRPYAVYADLSVRFKVQQVWNGQPVVVRQWSKVFPYGQIQQYNPNNPGQSWSVSTDSVMNARWQSTYRVQFEQSAELSDNSEAGRRKAREWHYQQAGQYYTDVVSALNTPGTRLHEENRKLTETVLLLQTYTKLGFAQTREHDDILTQHLYGNDRMPADVAGVAQVTQPFLVARNNYCASVDGDGRCVVKGDALLSPRTGQDQRLLPCDLPEVRDPIEACFAIASYWRPKVVRDRLEVASVRIAGGFQEGLPAVDYMIQSITTLDAVSKR